MSIRKIRNWWRVDFRTDGTRRRLRSPENSAAGARAYEQVLRKRLARGESLQPQPSARPLTTFADFASQWMATYVKTNNKASEARAKEMILRLHLLPVYGRMPLSAITTLSIEHYKASVMAAGLSAKTVNNHLAVLRKCLQTAVDWEELDKVPKVVLLHTLPPARDFLTVEESARLVLAADDPVWRAMILLALRTGMRYGELSGLDWSAVDLNIRVISVRLSVVSGIVSSPKTHRERFVAFPTSVRDALLALPSREGFVFSRQGGLPTSHTAALRALHRICRQAKLRPIGWHTLRHTCASQLGTLRGTLLEAQRLLGHSSLAMTERYTHVLPDLLHEAVATLDNAAAVASARLGTRWATDAEMTSDQPSDEMVRPLNLRLIKQKHAIAAACVD